MLIHIYANLMSDIILTTLIHFQHEEKKLVSQGHQLSQAMITEHNT